MNKKMILLGIILSLSFAYFSGYNSGYNHGYTTAQQLESTRCEHQIKSITDNAQSEQ